MNSKWPTVGVIMPVKNGEKHIGHALDSIARQTVKVAEIHVIDDGSTDATIGVIDAFARNHAGVFVHQGPGKGPGPARNVGLRETTADIIAFLDCDDIWPEGKLEVQLERLCAAPEVMMCSGFVQYFDKQAPDGLAPSSDSRTWEIFHVHLGASIYRREVFEQVGMFDERFTYSEDVDLMLRLREANIPFTILRDITLFYRRHPDSMTSTMTDQERIDFNRALFMSLSRRKHAGNIKPMAPFADFVGL